MIALIYLSMKGEVQVFGSWLRKLISDEVKSVQSAESGLTAITALHNTSNNSDPKFHFHFVENHQVISLLTFSSCIWFCRRQSFLFAHLFDQLLSECLIDWMIIYMRAGKKNPSFIVMQLFEIIPQTFGKMMKRAKNAEFPVCTKSKMRKIVFLIHL